MYWYYVNPFHHYETIENSCLDSWHRKFLLWFRLHFYPWSPLFLLEITTWRQRRRGNWYGSTSRDIDDLYQGISIRRPKAVWNLWDHIISIWRKYHNLISAIFCTVLSLGEELGGSAGDATGSGDATGGDPTGLPGGGAGTGDISGSGLPGGGEGLPGGGAGGPGAVSGTGSNLNKKWDSQTNTFYFQLMRPMQMYLNLM